MHLSAEDLLVVYRLIDFLEGNEERLCIVSSSEGPAPDCAGFLFDSEGQKCCAIPARLWRVEVFPKSAIDAARSLERSSVIRRPVSFCKATGWTAAHSETTEGPFTYTNAGVTSEYRVRGHRYPSNSLQQRRSFKGLRGRYYIIDLGATVLSRRSA